MLRESISQRLILVLTLCLTAIASISLLVDYRLSRTEILDSLQLQNQATVEGILTDMDNWLDGVEGTTLFLSRLLQDHEYTAAALRQIVKDIVSNNEDIYGATIALNPALVDDPAGFAPYYFRGEEGVAYADLAQGEQPYWQSDWFTSPAAARAPRWVEPYFDRDGGEALMTTFSVPVYRQPGGHPEQLYAVVTADITLRELRSYLQRLSLEGSGFGLLLSRKGAVLSANDSTVTMAHYRSVARGDARMLDELFNAALAGEVEERRLACPHRPGFCVIRMAALQSTGWPVGVVHSEDEMLAPLRQFRIKTLLMNLATLVLLALAVVFVTRRITRPLTALADASDRIARGELDAALPPTRGRDEVASLVKSFAAMQQDLKKHIHDLEAATASRARLEGELQAARDIQMSMLPGTGRASEHFDEYRLWARVQPAKSVGGDFYSYYHSERHLLLTVGDVSDKGVPAALFMARTISIIQQMSGVVENPGEAMARLNDSLVEGNENCMFVTLFLGALDLEQGKLIFASSGHTAPALLRDGRVIRPQQHCGPALGLAVNQEFPCNRIDLQRGDRLVIWTDGIDEAFNTDNQQFGEQRAVENLQSTADEELEDAGNSLFEALEAFSDGAGQSDDITLLLLDFCGPTKLDADLQRLSIERGPQLVSRLINWLEARTSQWSIAIEPSRNLNLVAEEIVTNIDKYGGLPAGAPIAVSLAREASSLVLEFRDGGLAFNPLQDAESAALGADIDSAAIGGLGVHLLRALSEHQSYERIDDCNVLRVLILTDEQRAD